MTIAAFKGTCPTCGHDHDADNAEFRRLLKAPSKEQPSAPSSEAAEMVRRLNSETVEAYRIGNAYIGSLLGQAAALLSKVGQGWERGHVGGGMYLPIPREATEFYIAWTDEAGITWRKNLLPLPPLPERP